MTKRNASDLNWVQVSLEDNLALAKRLDAVRLAEKTHKDLRAAFETQFVAAARKKGAIDEGYTLAFGYRFGKLSVAKVPEQEQRVTKASTKPVFKL
jgi:alpha-ketoglutarate-dependent taurine dioxygenase